MKQARIRIAIMTIVATVLVTVFGASYAAAHVSVAPGETLTGARELFTVRVPNEKDVPITGVRLVIPGAISSVTPTVAPGWEINTKKNGEAVSEINWTGGVVGVGLRQEFSFTAQVSARPGELAWRAYETYQDGSVAAWDQKPESGQDRGNDAKGPYSVTNVTSESTDQDVTTPTSQNTVALVVSGAAFVLGAVAVTRTFMMRRAV